MTLGRRELVEGISEAIKMGCIRLPNLFDALEADPPRVMALQRELIAQAPAPAPSPNPDPLRTPTLTRTHTLNRNRTRTLTLSLVTLTLSWGQTGGRAG